MKTVLLTAGNFYVAHNASLIGDVTVGELCSFWFSSVVRGDVAPVRIGRRVNLQDGAVIHCETGTVNVIEDDVSIGHGAVVHGAVVGRGTLVGMNSTILGGAKIGAECLIAAGTVVAPRMQVPERSVVMGVPGKIVRRVSDEEVKYMMWVAENYLSLAQRHERGEWGVVGGT